MLWLHHPGQPLPIKVLLKCINLSDEKFEIRNTIINIMSEILPVYNNCLTVYHKSLTDWLTLEGYKEHEFAADITGGSKRLWEVCKSIYRDIVSVKSESGFELSPEREFALKNGEKYLIKVGDTADFHWFVNIRLTTFKLRFYGRRLNVDYYYISNHYKSTLSRDVYWRMIQHYWIFKMIDITYETCEWHCFFLQSIANAHFDFSGKSFRSQTQAEYFFDEANEAKHILNDANEIWVEQLANVQSCGYEVIANAIFSDCLSCCVSSPDNKLLVCVQEYSIKVFKLPSLVLIFELKLDQKSYRSEILTFSPDSAYFLYKSITSCVCIAKKKVVEFIPQGPKEIYSCSFSSCGMKLVTRDREFLKVWDVKERELLAQVIFKTSVECCISSSCSRYILTVNCNQLFIWDSTKLKELDTKDICLDTCLKHKDNFEILAVQSPYQYRHDGTFKPYHFHLPNDQIVVVVPDQTPKEYFTWENRKCVISVYPSTLEVCDVKNEEVIDRFHIDCFPPTTDIDCMSKLDETNFLCCFNSRHVVVLSLKTSEKTSGVSYVNSLLQCVTVSPDHLYVACCYENCVLAIKNVDNGETLQAVQLQMVPEACWWSELYLWVVCKGVVLKFSCHSANEEILKSDPEECPLNLHRVLKFDVGVLVFQVDNKNWYEIRVSKICDDKFLYHSGNEENLISYSTLGFGSPCGRSKFRWLCCFVVTLDKI